jgi:hypothetical protein
MDDRRYNIATTIVLLVLLTIIMMATSCSKDSTPQPQQQGSSTPTTTPPHYFNSQYVRNNMIGSWNIYLEIHMGNDTTYEYYLPSMDVITFNQSTLIYNTPGTPIPYTYNNYYITATNHNYKVIDMNIDKDWMHMVVLSGSYLNGFDSLSIHMVRQ